MRRANVEYEMSPARKRIISTKKVHRSAMFSDTNDSGHQNCPESFVCIQYKSCPKVVSRYPGPDRQLKDLSDGLLENFGKHLKM